MVERPYADYVTIVDDRDWNPPPALTPVTLRQPQNGKYDPNGGPYLVLMTTEQWEWLTTPPDWSAKPYEL